MKSRWRRWGHWVFAGMAVGAAEIVPGISGGTVALLVGIYGRLISALAAFTPDQLLQQWRRRQLALAELVFLLLFACSSLLAIWLLSHPLKLIYVHFESEFRLFLLLLIALGLAPLLLRLRWRPATVIGLVIGVLSGSVWLLQADWRLAAEPATLLVAGAAAGALMVLPGVSGSYLLLLLGLYPAVLLAAIQLDFALLLPLAAGAGLGAMFCARLMKHLLERTGDGFRAFLYGLVAGSLPAIAPAHLEFSPAIFPALALGLVLGGGLLLIGRNQSLMCLVLCLPLLAAPAMAADDDDAGDEAGWLAYRIAKGENLSMIANLYGLEVSDLIRWNRLKPPHYRIFPGKQLRIEPGTQARLHQVEEGETLSGIALKYRTFIKRLKTMNGLASANLIYPGQVLRLAPELAPAMHRVRRGESLWQLALRYNLQLEELVAFNGLESPYQIHPGQQLVLSGKARSARPPAASAKAPAAKTAPAPPARSEPTAWLWPADGPLRARFHPARRKGIDIAGEVGEVVRAVAAGTVRYAGDGLFRDYGWLIILAHGRYLSIYAHNDKLLVKEGERVKAGQQIARMGNSGSEEVKLHFQIKFRGKPTDPLSLLPPRARDGVSVLDTGTYR